MEYTFTKKDLEDINNCLDKIYFFLISKEINIWIYSGSIKMYIRKSKRYINNEIKIVDFFDIANIEIKKKGKGIFSYILNKIREKNINIYIESILNKQFYEHLLKLGFKKDIKNEFDLNLYEIHKTEK